MYQYANLFGRLGKALHYLVPKMEPARPAGS